jgi:hypothetical protein
MGGEAGAANSPPLPPVNNFVAASGATVLHWLFDCMDPYLTVYPPRRDQVC